MRVKAKIIGIALLFLFIGYMADRSLFMHTHAVNGRTVTHSHPYSGNPQNPGHGHSAAGFALLALLSMMMMIVASTRLSTILTSHRAELFIDRFCHVRQRPEFCHNHLRAPPAVA
jgi:hypothetical protein